MENINVTRFRLPKLRDRLAMRHGQYITRGGDEKILSNLCVMSLEF